MPDDPKPTPETPPTPQPNTPEARNPDGSLKTAPPTPEPKPPEPKAGDEPKTEPKAGDKTPKTGAPEKYEAFKVPDGYTADEKAITEASAIFKELGLTQDQAQKLVDFQAKYSIESADAALASYEATRKSWRDSVVASDLGDGKDNLKPEVRAQIDKAISAIGDDKAISEFKSIMDLTGVGDNPAFVRALSSIGKLLSEGTLVKGGGPSKEGQSAQGAGDRPSAARALYPGLPSGA